MCRNLKKVEFEKNSEIRMLDRIVNTYSIIESFMIPSNVRVLKKDWCEGFNHVKEIKISPENDFFSFIDESHKIVASKSNESKCVYEILAFVCRDVKEIIVPETIKVISSNAFSMSVIERVFISKNVREIGYKAFFQCKFLASIEFDESSLLETICNSSFQFAAINTISLPRKLKEIKMSCFLGCNNLKNIEFLSDEIVVKELQNIQCSLISFPNAQKVIFNMDPFIRSNEIIIFFNSNAKFEIVESY